MRGRKTTIALVLLALAVLVAGCGDDEAGTTTTAAVETTTTAAPTTTTAAPTTTTTEAETTTTTVPAETTTTTMLIVREDADLVIWADDTRTPIFEEFAQQYAAENGITVAVQEIPAIEEIDDRVAERAPLGEGPDIFISANDVLGGLVADGLVEPLDLTSVAGDYAQGAIDAFTFGGLTYALPYAIENVALIRNTDLVPEAPATFEELEEIALGLVESGAAEIPLAVQAGGGAPYHYFPLYSSFGGYVFGTNADGSFNFEDIGLASEAGLASAEAFAAWGESGLLDWDITYDIMLEKFGDGSAPFAITGPWALPSFEGVNYVVEPIPPVQGGETRPFIGVQGIMVSAFSEAKLFATDFVLSFLATEEAQQAFFDADPRGPSHLGVLARVQETDPNLAGFAAAGADGVPIPSVSEMGAVWTPWQDAYQIIVTGAGDAREAFQNAAEQIATAIAAG
jgi:arabinogalactan oligomer/maltooligosaccharide transport system substrate-binding protein